MAPGFHGLAAGPPRPQISSNTIAQRRNSRTRKIITNRVRARSSDQIHNGLPRTAEARFHGISARQKAASRVPTQLARSECHTSPCISSAKLVVMPHDGQGSPVLS
ncbi:MAG TPA: hypothetical protein VG013_11355 [Gemmataceae bacterium]|nr:hypothetical protein [Gemmataceae bacterium]